MSRLRTLRLLLIIWILTLMIMSPSARAQMVSSENAGQYELAQEQVVYLGVIKIGQGDYYVFQYEGITQPVSKYLVFELSGKRTNTQSCRFFGLGCETNENLVKVVFSTLTYEYANTNMPSISRGLQRIYDTMIDTAHKKDFDAKWETIRQGIELLVRTVRFAPIRFGVIEIDLAEPLKKLALEKVGSFLFSSNPKWDDVIPRFRDFKEDIEQIGLFKERGQLSYDYEVNAFFGKLAAIEGLTSEIDAKTGTSLSNNLQSLDLRSLASNLKQKSMSEISRMNARVMAARNLALSAKDTFENRLGELAQAIHDGMRKDMNMDSYKKDYCSLKGKLDQDPLAGEQFKKFRNDATTLTAEVNRSITMLTQETSKHPDKPLFAILNVWLDQIFWSINKGC